jgi:hypothetical protein
MNYDRVIVELLDRIAQLEEKVDALEKSAAQRSASSASIIEEGSPKTRDKTKYVIDGRTFLKNRLVLEVVNKYVHEHPGISFEGLQQVFFDKLQGSFGVVRKRNAIEPQKQIRYFFKTDDIIYLADGTAVVVSNQWGKDNIKSFIVFAKSLGYEITEA